MTDLPHSRAWYARLARELGGYRHPWTRVLDGPDPEVTFDALLLEHLRPEARVLEAGCGHGPDAARFGSGCAGWVAYDRQPELLDLARANAPEAELHLWDGQGEVPSELRGPFDLIVSRRGPTSVIHHLNAVAAPNARLLYVGPRLDVQRVPQRLAAVDWTILGEWRVSVRAWVPTWEDWQTRCDFMGETARRGDWDAHAGARGMPYTDSVRLPYSRNPTACPSISRNPYFFPRAPLGLNPKTTRFNRNPYYREERYVVLAGRD